MFNSVDDLKASLLKLTAADFFEEHLRSKPCSRFPTDKIEYTAQVLSQNYNVTVKPDELIVVGSAKIGFALHEKRVKDSANLPAFRPISADSDIDLSICSPSLFTSLWHEVSAYLSNFGRIPYRQNKLGDYLSYGWLRLDQLPRQPIDGLAKCSKMKSVRGTIRNDRRLGHKMVDFGVFHDINHLKIYQTRSIELCKKRLENPL